METDPRKEDTMDDEPTIEEIDFEYEDDTEETSDGQCNTTKVAAMAGGAALVAGAAYLVTKKVREKLSFRVFRKSETDPIVEIETEDEPSEETPQKKDK
jgi:hypothetical protein